jgi:hypothetical protein
LFAESKTNNKKVRFNLHYRDVLCTDHYLHIQLCDKGLCAG